MERCFSTFECTCCVESFHIFYYVLAVFVMHFVHTCLLPVCHVFVMQEVSRTLHVVQAIFRSQGCQQLAVGCFGE